jgi:hypothetical protein
MLKAKLSDRQQWHEPQYTNTIPPSLLYPNAPTIKQHYFWCIFWREFFIDIYNYICLFCWRNSGNVLKAFIVGITYYNTDMYKALFHILHKKYNKTTSKSQAVVYSARVECETFDL